MDALTLSYLAGQADRTLAAVNGLSSFSEVAAWDQQAEKLIVDISESLDVAACDLKLLDRGLVTAEQERRGGSLLMRFFRSKEERRIAATMEALVLWITRLKSLARNLSEKIDFTPNNPEEQKQLVRDLKLRKKDLAIEKREIAATMREIKAGARAEAASAVGFLGGSQRTKEERRQIYLQAEAEQRPHESEKARIEREILQLDRLILWAERFR